MTRFELMTVVIIGLLQVCTANPVTSPQENDLTKLFTPDELIHARNAGLSQFELIDGKTSGLTLDEIIKMNALIRTTPFEYMANVCEILMPGQKMASNYTTAQEEVLKNIVKLIDLVPKKDIASFFRTTVCDFVSEPNSPSFGPKFVPHTTIILLKKHAKTGSALDRVNLAKHMCCIDEGANYIGYEGVGTLLDEEMKEFEEKWNNLDATTTPESITNLCDFLRSTKKFDANQCQKNGPVDGKI
ncbi:uncharacterized protein LOC119069269 [Bradysia coprophila]|uniref:uncharacterized protein LOC119069269 n=1 Tax=Bradysia coprophila TaxID=38358 RepID=UPI00187DB498|nr:uncharacterized protein LOC119069269 [Bradysia coprophila]